MGGRGGRLGGGSGGSGATRGSSAGGAGFSATSVKSHQGQDIDLSRYPLQYGHIDELTGAIRDRLEQFEDTRIQNRIEYHINVDKNGNVLDREYRGGHSSVRYTINPRTVASSHIHPRTQPWEERTLGGTFSFEDIEGFVKYGDSHMSARATEGAYRIFKTPDFKPTAFQQWFQNQEKTGREQMRFTNEVLAHRYRSGWISYADYLKGKEQTFNEFLVNQHNALLGAQGQFGYKYALEKPINLRTLKPKKR